MRLDSARDLKLQVLGEVVDPLATAVARVRPARARALAVSLGLPGLDGDPSLLGLGARAVETVPQVQRSLALGVAPHGRGFRLAVRLQRTALRDSPILEHLRKRARGEVDIRLVGRIDKRARRSGAGASAQAADAWYRRNTRPLLLGASVGHVDVTAGTTGGFVSRGAATCLLSNNHVLANEDRAAVRDWVVQRARFDGGKEPADRVARLLRSVPLKRRGANLVDAAIASVERGTAHDPQLLRGLVNGRDRKLKGVGPELIDEGAVVYKLGRTTGPTKGRVTAFELDNVVVGYDQGNLRFDGQIEIEGSGTRPFSDGGDSGSLIVNARMEAMALLFAGSDMGGRNGAGLTYANPIHRVLASLKATLLW